MTTITRENAEIKSFITGFLSDPAHDNQSTDSLLANVFRIAQASLEAEPAAWMRDDADGREYNARNEFSGGGGGVPLYAAPPIPVVPEEKPMPNPLKMYAVDAVAAIAEVRGWNACRAAMLQSQDSGIKDSWISCSERMPDDGQHVIILCDGAFVLYAQYRDGEFFDIVRNGDEFFETQSRNVTHWMPLPEPPQEVNRG
ncbi:DUF551 domain-containing protein [Escherichia coli]|nr:DUF551 domain-containing protein [Escherichia coli]EFA3512436.1 DUF551 domain-containing protein [Escherichia coli]